MQPPPFGEEVATSPTFRINSECPRQESNLRTRFRKPLLYPLSYGGFWLDHAVFGPGYVRSTLARRVLILGLLPSRAAAGRADPRSGDATHSRVSRNLASELRPSDAGSSSGFGTPRSRVRPDERVRSWPE